MMYNDKRFQEFLKEFMNDDFFSGLNNTRITLPKIRRNNDLPTREYGQNVPTTNVYEDEWSFRYELATPGFTKSDLSIELENTTLIVKGERKIENKKDGGEYISKEYHSTKFFRSFSLPENVVYDEVHAKVKNGITTLFLPKVSPTKKQSTNRKIDIS
jgi:HSP20 family protein